MGSERQPRVDEVALTDPELARVIEELEEKLREADALQIATTLRKHLSAAHARRAAELIRLRRRARGRFPNAERSFFTARSLEQATRVAVARARARRISNLVTRERWVWDATCGAGGDALALAASDVRIVASDRDPELADITRANLEVAGRPGPVAVADALGGAIDAEFWIVDPDRRAQGARSLRPDQWSPRLDAILARIPRFAGACIKLPPAFDVGADASGAPPPGFHEARFPFEWQWTSVDGELCEVALWAGEWCERGGGHRRASVIADGATDHLDGPPEAVRALDAVDVDALRWLADPDPAVVRAGLLGNLAARLGLAPIAPQCAYLGSTAPESPPAPTPWARLWRVADQSSADERRVRAMLARHDVGAVAVRKRGHPAKTEELARSLRGTGRRRGELAIARLETGHRAFLLEAAESGGR